jgi:hypothetical protein
MQLFIGKEEPPVGWPIDRIARIPHFKAAKIVKVLFSLTDHHEGAVVVIAPIRVPRAKDHS